MDRRSFLGLMALGGLGATAPGEVGPKMTNSVPLHERASGTPATGTVTLSFPPCRTGRIWLGAITIPSALPTDTWNLTIGGQLAAVVVGSGPFGPVQVQSGQVLSLAGTVGLTTPYQAVLSGIDDPSSDPTSYTGPIALPGAGTVTFPQTLIGTFTAAAGTVKLPANTETLWIFTSAAAGEVLKSVVGTTTGEHYPPAAMPLLPGAGVNPIYVVPVSPAADPSVTITWGAVNGPWHVVADAATRQYIDQVLQAIYATGGLASPGVGLEMLGTDGTNARVIAVSQQGIPYAIPSAPDTATGDHPPNELLAASINSDSPLLAAPGGGLRYRIFAVIIATTNVNGIGSFAYVAATKTGATVYLGFAAASPPSASPIPLSGLALDANTAVTVGIVGGSVGTTVYATAIYTLEAV
jgi:hypothetical protein